MPAMQQQLASENSQLNIADPPGTNPDQEAGEVSYN